MKMELILILIIIFLPLLANAKINSSYKKYSKVKNSMGLTGNDVARKILDKHGLNNIDIIFYPTNSNNGTGVIVDVN